MVTSSREAGQSQRDLVAVITGPFDVVGRVVVAARPPDGILDEIE